MSKEKQENAFKDQYRDMREYMRSFVVELDEDADGADRYTAQCKIWGEMVNACVPLPTPGVHAQVAPEVAQEWLRKSKLLKARLEKENPGVEIKVFWSDKSSVRVEFIRSEERVIPLV